MPITTQQRWLLFGGLGVGGAGLIAYMYKKNKEAKAAAAAATAKTQQATSGAGAQYAYGYGSVSPYAYGYGYSVQPEVYGYGLGYYGYGVSGGAGGGVIAPAATTNAMWSQAAVTQLTNQGYTGSTVQAALGVYLTGGTLTADQETIVQAAIAVEGYPPQPGPNGYPPAMNTAGTTGGGTGGGTTSSTTTTGTTAGAPAAGAISNLQQVGATKNSITVSWNPTTGVTGQTQTYAWAIDSLSGWPTQSIGKGTTQDTALDITGLQPNTTYNFGIQALPGGPGNNIHVKTS
jgi:Fibronectin type III domain